MQIVAFALNRRNPRRLGLLSDQRLELARVFRIEPVEPAMPPIAVVNQFRVDEQPLPPPRRSQRTASDRRGRILLAPLALLASLPLLALLALLALTLRCHPDGARRFRFA